MLVESMPHAALFFERVVSLDSGTSEAHSKSRNAGLPFRPADETGRWWPETGSNRRRRPFQGRLPSMLSGLGSMEVKEMMGFTGNRFGLEWAYLGSFRFLCVRYLYVEPVFRGVP